MTHAPRFPFRRLRLRIEVARIRRAARRHGLPPLDAYADGAVMLGFLAVERMKWTRESYAAAALAELPKVRPFIGGREADGLRDWLTAHVSPPIPKEHP